MSNSDIIRLSPNRDGSVDKKKRLGRGLGALLGETRREEPLAAADELSSSESTVEGGPLAGGLANISVSAIEPLKGQPRTHFDEKALDELAASIGARGVIQPIIVRPKGNGRYELVAGERRWRAAQRARLHDIPAIIRTLDDGEVMALALIENLQREDLNPIEEARAYQRLADNEGMTQSEIAELVDKSRSHVANLQRLLVLPDAVQDRVANGTLDMGHARALIGYDDAEELAKEAADKQLSVREVEKRVRQAKGSGKKSSASRNASAIAENDADIAAVQVHLQEFLGLTVKIKTDDDPRKGQVSISYKTLDQLDLICQRLTGGAV
ncbi:ParB/RepB/Spo0J family partition protein [Qipengyuania atrilutea]|uniref:ParB/RepB/Spo0J family partition protein n=1 Tax=Qipengyuania atrilutea TaxID=2744473 RepID=A0A850H2N4_9SPHN|nr:ParB/RepB/Spo0J family partition protein [Actirhodobacter atriluteus]NVD44452.1 ParB/RepB/Spo0J family partition protein [Actirhodobacter atriluteus]